MRSTVTSAKIKLDDKIKARIPQPKGLGERFAYWVQVSPGHYIKLTTAKVINAKMRGATLHYLGRRGPCPKLLVENSAETYRAARYSYTFTLHRFDQLEKP
jgi:hypothetical protein